MGSDSENGSGWEAEDTAEFADPAMATEREVELSLLGDALGLLPPRDRQIIELRYRQAKSFLEIARRLNLSESRVCQLHRRAVSRLRLRICSQLVAA
jgi:RNA polymerase sigma factor for flagellar operon FliA